MKMPVNAVLVSLNVQTAVFETQTVIYAMIPCVEFALITQTEVAKSVKQTLLK